MIHFLYIKLFLALETTSHDWKTPKEVLDAYGQKEFKLAPPTWITVTELASFSSLSELVAIAKQGRDITPIQPTFSMGIDESGNNIIYLCLPGDKESLNPVDSTTLYVIMDNYYFSNQLF